jgi:hypothetical protein
MSLRDWKGLRRVTISAEIQNPMPLFLNKLSSVYMRLEYGCCILELRSVPLLSYDVRHIVNEIENGRISYTDSERIVITRQNSYMVKLH